MKLINLFFAVFAIVLFFVASCKTQPEDSEFKKSCQEAGYEWMLMKPTQDGKFIKDSQTCWGCMVEGIEHVCDKEKFNEIIAPR